MGGEGAGRKKSISNMFERTAGTGQMGRPEGAGNFDNMDDFNIVKAVDAQTITGSTRVSGAEMTLGNASGAGMMLTDSTGIITGGHTIPAGGGAETDPIWNAQSGAFLNDGSLYSISGALLDGSLYSISGALLDGSLYSVSGAVLTEADPVFMSLSGSIPLSQIANPEASKTFNFGNNKSLTFTSVDNTPTAGEGTFNFEATGNFTGDLVHIHQHGGNAGAGTHLLHAEAEDSDVGPIFTSGAQTYDIVATKGIQSLTTISGTTIVGDNVTSGDDPGHGHSAYAISGSYLDDGSLYSISGALLDGSLYSISGALLDGSLYSISGALLDGGLYSISGANLEAPSAYAISGALLNAAEDFAISGALLDGGLYSISGANLESPSAFASSGAATITFGAHVSDASDPHGSVLTQTGIDSSGTISGADIVMTADNDASGAAICRNILIGTEASPGAAATWTQGTVYLQYTA